MVLHIKTLISPVLVVGVLVVILARSVSPDAENQRKCSTLPQVQHRLNAVIVECQNQVKEDMIREALQQTRFSELQQQQQLQEQPQMNPAFATSRADLHWMIKRFKRDLSDTGFYDHPTIMSKDDKEIAGVSDDKEFC